MEKIKIALSGVGNRSLPKNPEKSNWFGWVELIQRSEHVELVAAQDISQDSLNRIIDQGYLTKDQIFTDLDSMLDQVECDALLITNPAQCHAETIQKAVEHDLHCLVEKPFVDNLQQGSDLIKLIEEKKKVVAVIQNWRSKDVGRKIFQTIQEGSLGSIGHVFFRYVRDRENANYPAYIFEEQYPLLYAMGIHHLDLLRYVLQDEFVSVQGHAFKPPWSLYQSETGLNLFFKTSTGVSIVYTGTISSKNQILPQESLVIEGSQGTLINESQWMEPPLWLYPRESQDKVDLTSDVQNRSMREQYDISDKCILNDFCDAVINKKEPICSAADAMKSIAVLEASRLACETGKMIDIKNMMSEYTAGASV